MNSSYEEKLQSVLDATPNGFCLVDRQYRVLLCTPAAHILFEKKTGNNLYEGVDLLSLVSEDRKNIMQKKIDAAFKGEITTYEIKYITLVSGWMKVRFSPAFGTNNRSMGVCLYMEDITDQKNLEEEAYLREMKFLSVFNFSGIGIALVSPEGKWLNVNPALVKLLGYSREELLQRTFQDITHPADLEKDLAFVQQMLRREIETYQMEKRYYHKNGSIIWVMLTVSLVRHVDGSPDFFIAQVVDITINKALIKELEAKNNALDFAARDLETRIQQQEEFTHLVGHNLRGPVTNISSMVSLLRESSPEELPVWLDRLQQITDRLLATLTELVKYAQVKLASGIQYEDCDIKWMCEEALAQVAATDILNNITVHFDLKYTVVSYAKIYMQSILYNLLSNAVKYRREDIVLVITVTADVAKGRQWLMVTDNGTGFDMEKNKNKIFRLNSTFHKGYNSKGIGLFITKAQVEKLGGTITVKSKPNEGAAFTITF